MMENAYDEDATKSSKQSHLQAIKSLLHSKEDEAKIRFNNFCSQL